MSVRRGDRRPRPLAEAEVRRLSAAAPTYPDVGGTGGDPPLGWDALRRTARIGTGRACFETAADAVLGWQVQLRSGIAVAASSARIRRGTVAVLRLGLGPVGIDAPVRIVDVIDEPNRQGFAYGTLPGHPESGEERFCVELAEDQTVTATISAFSHPASRLARLVPPATRVVQHWMAGRYLAALGS